MAQDPGGGAARPAYLVVLRHVVVAQDIALTIGDYAPDALVRVAVGPAEALAALDGIERLAVAFVGEGPGAWRGSALEAAVAARGGRVVLMGSDAEARGEAEGFAVLARPFSIASVLAHLKGPGGA